MSIIAAAGALARDGLTSWIDAAYVCADGTADPLRSPEPSAFTYSKSFNCSGEIPPAGLSVSGDKARERRCAIARTSLPRAVQDRFCLCSTAENLKANDVGLDLFEHGKAPVEAKCSRLRYHVVLSVFPQDEEPWLAGLLVIRGIVSGRREWWSY